MNSRNPILIVEDCEEAVPALQIALESCYSNPVYHFADGERALAHLRSDGTLPLAIITDLNLPVLDGFGLIVRIRGSQEWSGVPIIVVSADPDPRTPGRARDSGADAFFAKPYSPAAICTCLELILNDEQRHDKGRNGKDQLSFRRPSADDPDPSPNGRTDRD